MPQTQIKSICISHVDCKFDASFIADIFNKTGIAKVSKIYMEPHKGYNRVYINIKSWHETETAYHFMERLRNPYRETRLVYEDDNWWSVSINKRPEKLEKRRCATITVFNEVTNDCDENIYDDCDVSSIIPVADDIEDFDDDMPKIDVERTSQLKHIIKNFSSKYEIDNYLHEMDYERDLWYSEQYIYDTLSIIV